MSKSVRRAEVTSRKEIIQNVRYTEFNYTFTCCGNPPYTKNSFDLLFVDYDFEIKCKVNHDESISRKTKERPFCTVGCIWSSIEFQKSNKNFFGTYEILSRNTTVSTSKFDIDSLPFKRCTSMPIFCKMVGSNYTIKLQVYRKDEKLFSTFEAYHKFFESKSFFDFTFIVENERFSVNKSILSSQSDVFATMFDSDMTEKSTGKTVITDVEPKIFNLLIRFIYCGKLDCDDVNDLLKLTMVADKYAVRSLVNLCVYRLMCNLSVDNAVDTLLIAEHLNLDFLKKECASFIVKNKNKIVDADCIENILENLEL